MNALAGEIRSALTALEMGQNLPNLSAAEKRGNAIALGCRLFEQFLAIHPYANGNGHAGRLLLVAILGHLGYWLKRFEINRRPPDPPYSQLIALARSGNRAPLETFVAALF